MFTETVIEDMERLFWKQEPAIHDDSTKVSNYKNFLDIMSRARPTKPRKRQAKSIAEVIKTSTETPIEEM